MSNINIIQVAITALRSFLAKFYWNKKFMEPYKKKNRNIPPSPTSCGKPEQHMVPSSYYNTDMNQLSTQTTSRNINRGKKK